MAPQERRGGRPVIGGDRRGRPAGSADSSARPVGPQVLAALERNLREQIAAEERLLAALQRQRVSVGRLAGRDLCHALEEASEAVAAVARLQAERRRLLEAWAGPAPGGSGAAAAVWEALLEGAPEERRGRLAALRERARSLAGRVARANGINRRLTERASAHFSSLLDTLAGGGNPTYAPHRRGCVAVSPTCGAALIDRVA